MIAKALPQIIILFLIVLSIGSSLESHDKPKTGKNSFWSSLISNAILLALLWWGGFFDVFLGL